VIGRLARRRRSADVVFYAGPWIDESWVRTTFSACREAGMDVLLAVAAPRDGAAAGVAERYGRDLIAPADAAALERLRGRLFVTATTNITRIPVDDQGWTRVHMPHSLVSLHAIYPPDAFDGFDLLFACGPHHVREWEALARWRGLERPPAPEAGYGKLDLLRALEPPPGGPDVLLAPSWGDGNVLDSIGLDLCRALAERGLSVTVRPHPMLVDTAREIVSRVRDAEFESPLEGEGAILSARTLVTDYSGVAMEWAAIRPRPIVFVETPRKIVNPDWEQVGLPPVEVALREELGIVAAPDPDAVAEAVAGADFDAGRQSAALAELLFDPPGGCGRRAASLLARLAA
jgi:CDP-Glycerol:Poly(glycerophosphate) glycerophosphotransferase